MRRSRMLDNQRPPSQPECVHSGDRAIRYIGKGKPAHRVESHHPDPVGNQRVLAALRRENSAIGMGYDLGPQPPKYDGPKVMVGMMVGEYHPGNRLRSYPSDGREQLLPLLGAGQRIDDHDACPGDHKTGVGSSLRAPSGVSDGGIHSGRELANCRRR